MLNSINRDRLTPLKLFHMKLRNNSLCWKGREQTGTFYHCWWECEKAQTFWKIITFQASKIVSLSVPCSPEIILLNSWEGTGITGYTRELLLLCFLAAKCSWAKLWKSHWTPSVKDWMAKLWDLTIEDKLAESILCSDNTSYESSFLECWFFFLGYAEKFQYVSDCCPRKYKCISLY